MSEDLVFFVAGLPAAQGSKRHVGNGRMIEMSKAVAPWREAVRAETQRAMQDRFPLTGPLECRINFFLPRPKTLPKKVTYPAKRPDLDKLIRAVLDGLTAGGAWGDDGQVIALIATKEYAGSEDKPGCRIQVMEES